MCFGLLTWALVEGAVVETTSDGWIKPRIPSSHRGYNKVYTRKDDPGVYWKGVGILGFFGALFAVVAVLEYRSYLVHRDYRGSENSSSDLLAKIDHACRLYPEESETLLRARAAVVDLKNADVEIALDHFLDKALVAHDREATLKDIQNLAKALNLIGRF